MDQKYIVALELSGSQVKGAVASIADTHNGSYALPTIEAIATEDNADCVQYGRVQNVINAAKLTDTVLRKLQNDPALDGGTINGAFVALAGRSLSSEKASAEIVLPSEMVITNEILTNLFVEASKMASPNRQVLKVLPRKYVVDSQTMPNPVGALGRKLRGDFTLVTCNSTNQRNLDLMAADKERVNLTVKNYIVTPLAIADMVLDEEAKQLGCVLVDLGYQTLTISIYKDRALQYLATLPIGAHNITRDISVGLNWTLEKAEKMKCTQGDATPTNMKGTDEVSRMNSYVAARAYEIVANINANIGYANYKAADLPEGFILVGRGARLHNFDNLLSTQSKMKVRYAQVPTSINFGHGIRISKAEDYMGLLAIILRISRKNDFTSCVTFPVKEEKAPAITQTKEATDETPVTEYSGETSQRPTRKPVNDDDWDMDDPDPATQLNKKKEKTEENTESKRADRRNLISKLKNKWYDILTPSNMDDDAEI